MNPHYHEWLNLTLRWIHMTVGIAWIGASFYFNWLENNLERKNKKRDEIAGDLWALHGGGFYYLEKYKVGPQAVPDELHWFKYEAYFTWLSGMLLLLVVYYMQPAAYMLDPSVADISGGTAIALGVSSLIVGWLVYDLLCRSPLVERGTLFALIGFTLVTACSYILTRYLSGRAAFMHVGAMIGTIMAGNVFMVIIPAQKKLVDAVKAGGAPDPAPGKNALRRSRHNNYMTLPVLFVMISNHFPSTYSGSQNWIILMGIFFFGGLVRHYFNVRKNNPASIWMIPVAIAGLSALCIYTAPRAAEARGAASAVTTPRELFVRTRAIIAMRCLPCHSSSPSDELFTSPPNGLLLEEPAQLRALSERIKIRAVDQKTMPLANRTGMTDAERSEIAAWFQGGAPVFDD